MVCTILLYGLVIQGSKRESISVDWFGMEMALSFLQSTLHVKLLSLATVEFVPRLSIRAS